MNENYGPQHFVAALLSKTMIHFDLLLHLMEAKVILLNPQLTKSSIRAFHTGLED